MPASHFLLALLVVIIWGINFLFVKLGLEEISPFLLCALRFILASLPAVFFIKPPAIPCRVIITYGLVMFALQFSLLFSGMHVGMTSGMASLLMQTQVFFSMFFASILLKQHSNVWQILGALISFAGIGLVALHFDNTISLPGFVLILAAAATWGIGNLIIKKSDDINMISVVVWGSLVASFPMLLLALIIEGPSSFSDAWFHLSWTGATALLYIVYISTWIGYGTWNWLLGHYPVGMIVPFTLLVPVIGIASSVLILDEPLEPWKIAACLLVIGGLCINLLGSHFFRKKYPVI